MLYTGDVIANLNTPISPISQPINNSDVAETFERYPDVAREKLLILRQLIFDTATDLNIKDLEETLKWGEPSYLTRHGSTVRLAWRKSYPDQVGIFFNCKTKLIDTFKEIYQGKFIFEGARAILFDINNDEIPREEIKHCIELSLTYRKIKHLPMLGV